MPLDPKLLIAAPLWSTLLSELHRRTEGRHESGAFLLGTKADDHREVQQVVYYDQLDSARLQQRRLVILHADSFGPLWDMCRTRNLSRSSPTFTSIRAKHGKARRIGQIR